MSSFRVLIADKLHPFLLNELQKKGVQCVVNETISQNELIRQIHKYDGLVIRSRLTISKGVFDKADQLKFVARAGSGIENINIKEANLKEVLVISSPEANAPSVAEHALGLLLSLLNNIHTSSNEVKKAIWSRNSNWGTTLQGKTVGIIGYGHTGSAFSKLLTVFGCEILAYDKYKSNFGNQYVKEVSLNALQAKADIISVHLPLTDETKYYINNEFFDKLAKPCYLLNTSRGLIVSTKAINTALNQKKLIGVGLDVLEHEKSDFEKVLQLKSNSELSSLLNNKKSIITPHVAGWTHESFKLHSVVLYNKIKATLNL